MALVVAIGMIIVLDLILLIGWAIDSSIEMALFGEADISFKTLKKIIIISNVVILVVVLLFMILEIVARNT